MLISILIDTDRKIDPLDDTLKARARVEQLDVTLRLVPFTILVSLSVVQVIAYLFWSEGNRAYLVSLEATILPLAVVALHQCRRWRSRPKPAEVRASLLRSVVLGACGYGLLLGTIPIMLFAGADAEGRLLISSSCAGLIATGMSAAVFPPVAIGYSGLIILGSFIGLAATGELFYINVGILLASMRSSSAF